MVEQGMVTGIIGAMAEEIELIQSKIQNCRTSTHAGITFYEGQWHDVSVVLCKSGVGKVNAAVCTQILIDQLRAGRILFTGVAGALDPGLDIGDLVISTDCMQHDMDVTALGFARGVIPYADVSIFSADALLVDIAEQASKQLFDRKVIRGRVLSGDQFIASRELVVKLREQLGGACIEMEGAAVAQVCAMNDVPYVVIRSMSDKADGSAHINFAEFTKMASLHSSQLIEQIIHRLQAR